MSCIAETTDLASNSPTRSRSSGASSSTNDAFDYDTSNSISEEDESSDEAEAADEAADVVKEQEEPVAASPIRSARRRSTMENTFGSAMPFEDSPNVDVDPESPFSVGASPVGGRKSSILGNTVAENSPKVREGAKGRSGHSPVRSPKSPTSPTKRRSAGKSANKRKTPEESVSAITYEDVDAGGNDDNEYYEEAVGDDYMDTVESVHDASVEDIESSGNKNRRVSFTQDTSAEQLPSAASSAVKRGRGRPPKTPTSNNSSTHTTPESARSVRTAMSTPGSEEFARGRKVMDETFEGSSDEEAADRTDMQDSESDDEEGKNASGFADDSFAAAMRKRKKYFNEDEEDEEEEDEDGVGGGSRRSKRVTKGKKLAWWKGERPVYDAGRMIGLLTANPTPKKNGKNGKKVGRPAKFNEGELSIVKSEMPIVLPTDIKFASRDSAEMEIWDDAANSTQSLKVLCYSETNENAASLPITAPRPEGKDIVGFAAQSFNVPEISNSMSGWISGFVDLPPGAIKDAEGVGECTQVFFISECQDGALEFGMADPAEPEWKDETAQRHLLRKGDTFFVPPGNIYRLENHSSNKPCFIFWTIIKPVPPGDGASIQPSADEPVQ